MDIAVAGTSSSAPNAAIRDAVHQHDEFTRQGILERLFTFAFRGLVYAQIWEDPAVDMAALELRPGTHLVTIASGGCNVLSYLTADPARITAVDLNAAHVALGRLKIAAARHVPDQASFHSFFARADHPANIAIYETHVAPHLDPVSRAYWEGRDPIGRRRIGGFARNFYRRGLLGSFIIAGQTLARIYGIDTREMLAATSLAEQRRIFNTRFAPLFDKKFMRWLTGNPAALFGLGIPPAQYQALLGDAPDMASVLRARLEKLACDFPIADNYFAWQAFGRGYGTGPDAPLPPYLQPQHHATIVDRIDRIDYRHANFAAFLRSQPAMSCDRYVLLDAQDWMTDAQLTELWTEIGRTARPGARVLFRTAAEPSLLPGRVPSALLDRWRYEAEASAGFTRADRSSIYGGVHLYTLAEA